MKPAIPRLLQPASRAFLGPCQRRAFASQRVPKPPPFPTVSSCPSPTCSCAETPSLPADLPIDTTSKLTGVVSAYQEHVIVCTGKDDWTSRIEEEDAGDNLAADLKELFGRGGVYSDPFHPISVLNASLPPTPYPRQEVINSSAFLFPSFKYVPYLPRLSFDAVDALARGFLLPRTLHSAHAGLSPIHRDRLTRQDPYASLLPSVQDVHDVKVLICGHGGRDQRCGIIGPVLRKEFEEQLPRQGVTVLQGPIVPNASLGDVPAVTGEAAAQAPERTARVGLISHIGGHKFAGNVIIYIPPGHKTPNGESHPLSGQGIWYGRIEPKHVEGLVKETILKGVVVTDHLRGGITQDRKMIWL